MGRKIKIMDMGRWLYRSRPGCVWLGGGVLWLLVCLVQVMVGSPYAVFHMAETVIPLPPLWLWGLGWQAVAFLTGCAIGYVLGLRCRSGGREVWILRGGIYIVLSVMGVLWWYPLLVEVMAPLMSWLCLLAASVCAVLSLTSWWRISHGATAVISLWTVWLWMLLICQLVVMLHI